MQDYAKDCMMRKVLEECVLISIVLEFPLAMILAIPGDGKIAILSMLPIFILGGIAWMKLGLREQLFFEPWIAKRPIFAVPILVTLLAGIIFGEMRIIIRTKLPEVAIPRSTTHEEVRQALAEEFPEFR